MARLYAATGDGIARLDEIAEAWRVELSLPGSGAQCLAVDPGDPDTVYAGLARAACGAASTAGDAGSTARCPSRACSRSLSARPTGRCTPAPSRAGCSAATTAAGAGANSTRCSSFPRVRPGASRRGRGRRMCAGSRPSPHDADLLLVGIELGGLMRSTDGGADLAGPPSRRAARRALARLAPARTRGAPTRRAAAAPPSARRRRDLAAGRRGPRPPLHLVGRRRSRRPGLLVRLGQHRPLRRPRRRRPAGAHLPAPRRRAVAAAHRRVAGAARRRCPTRSLATDGRLFAGLADGQIWESRDRGDSWAALRLQGDPLGVVVASPTPAADRLQPVRGNLAA